MSARQQSRPIFPSRRRRNHISSPHVDPTVPLIPRYQAEEPRITEVIGDGSECSTSFEDNTQQQETVSWDYMKIFNAIQCIPEYLYNALLLLINLIRRLLSAINSCVFGIESFLSGVETFLSEIKRVVCAIKTFVIGVARFVFGMKKLAWLFTILGGVAFVGVIIYIAYWISPIVYACIWPFLQFANVLHFIGVRLGAVSPGQNGQANSPFVLKGFADENLRRIQELVDRNAEDNLIKAALYKRQEELQHEHMDAVSAMGGKFLLQQRAAEYVQSIRNLVAHVKSAPYVESAPADHCNELDAYLEILNLGGAALHDGASNLADTRYTLSHTMRQDSRLAHAMKSGALDRNFAEQVLDLTNKSRKLHHDALTNLSKANDIGIAMHTLMLQEYKALMYQASGPWFYLLSGSAGAADVYSLRRSHLEESIRLLQELGIGGEHVLYEFNDHNFWIAAVANQVRKMQESSSHDSADSKALYELLSAKSREMSYYK